MCGGYSLVRKRTFTQSFTSRAAEFQQAVLLALCHVESRSRGKTSLDISQGAECQIKTEIVRDSSTSLGMTGQALAAASADTTISRRALRALAPAPDAGLR